MCDRMYLTNMMDLTMRTLCRAGLVATLLAVGATLIYSTSQLGS